MRKHPPLKPACYTLLHNMHMFMAPQLLWLIRRNATPEDWHPALHPGSLKVTKSSSFDGRTQASKGTATTP